MKKQNNIKGKVGFSTSFDNTKLENVWDRVMTYGKKAKDGIEYDFTDDFFQKIIDNFAKSSRTCFGSDYEHQTMNAALNGKPAPNLAYYNAYAVIKDGRVKTFFSKDEKVQPPTAIGREDGLYAYRFKATPLGKQLIPNYNEISPLFDTEDTNEKGELIGPNINNISFVNVSHQEGTTVGLKKGKNMEDKEMYGMLGFKDGMEPSEEELKEKMKMFMSKMSKAKMGDLAGEEIEREEEKEEKVHPGIHKEISKMKKGKMDGASVESIEGSGSGKDDLINDDSDEEDEVKDLDKEQKKMMARMSKQLAETNKKLADLQAKEDKRAESDADMKATAFAKLAVAQGRWPADGLKKLVGFAKIGKGEDAISPFEKGTFTSAALSKKIFNGGNYEGVTESYTAETPSDGQRRSGVSLSKAMKDYAKKNKITFSHVTYNQIAQAVAEEHPDLVLQYVSDVSL